MASVSLASAEFHNHETFENLPGIIEKDYTYPKKADLKYYADLGFKMVRVPFRWERLENWKTDKEHMGLGAPVELRNQDLDEIRRILQEAEELGLYVLLDLHNYARYYYNTEEHIVRLNKEDGIPAKVLGDFWYSLIEQTVVKGNHKNALYGIMNEPHNIISAKENTAKAGEEWAQIAEAVIYAIRAIDKKSPIIVPGYQWSSAELWEEYNPTIHNLNDIDHMIVFEAHCYFDKDSSGKYNEWCDDPNPENCPPPGYWPYGEDDTDVGVHRVKPFVEWTDKHKARGFVGEFGIPYPKTPDWPDGINEDFYFKWKDTMTNFMDYLEEKGKPYCYWAGGDWWYDASIKKDYFLSCHPIPDLNAARKPQLDILIEYNEISKRRETEIEMKLK